MFQLVVPALSGSLQITRYNSPLKATAGKPWFLIELALSEIPSGWATTPALLTTVPLILIGPLKAAFWFSQTMRKSFWLAPTAGEPNARKYCSGPVAIGMPFVSRTTPEEVILAP